MTPASWPAPSMTGAPWMPFSRKSFASSRRSIVVGTAITSRLITSRASRLIAGMISPPARGAAPCRTAVPSGRRPGTAATLGRERSRRSPWGRVAVDRGQVDPSQHAVDALHADAQPVAQPEGAAGDGAHELEPRHVRLEPLRPECCDVDHAL